MIIRLSKSEICSQRKLAQALQILWLTTDGVKQATRSVAVLLSH